MTRTIESLEKKEAIRNTLRNGPAHASTIRREHPDLFNSAQQVAQYARFMSNVSPVPTKRGGPTLWGLDEEA